MYAISLMEPLLSTYKFRKNLKQDGAVAKRLGVEPTALANYKKGERRMPDTAIAELADGIEVPMSDIVAAVNIGLVRTENKEKEFWLKRIQNKEVRTMAEKYRTWQTTARNMTNL